MALVGGRHLLVSETHSPFVVTPFLYMLPPQKQQKTSREESTTCPDPLSSIMMFHKYLGEQGQKAKDNKYEGKRAPCF